MYIRKKQNDTCGVVAMTTVLPLVLSKLELEVPVFVLIKYYPISLMRKVLTILEPCLFRAGPPVPLKGLQIGIF